MFIRRFDVSPALSSGREKESETYSETETDSDEDTSSLKLPQDKSDTQFLLMFHWLEVVTKPFKNVRREWEKEFSCKTWKGLREPLAYLYTIYKPV